MKQAYSWEASPANTVEFGTEADFFTVTLGSESELIEYPSGAYGFTDVAISGLWHVSRGEIDAFRNDRITDVVSKRGPGTYVGTGQLCGDNLQAARSQPHVVHDVVARGNYFVLPLEDAYDIVEGITDALKIEDEATLESLLRMNAGHRLNTILRNYKLNGSAYDGFIEYAAESQPFIAEGVIFEPEGTLSIIDRRLVVPNDLA